MTGQVDWSAGWYGKPQLPEQKPPEAQSQDTAVGVLKQLAVVMNQLGSIATQATISLEDIAFLFRCLTVIMYYVAKFPKWLPSRYHRCYRFLAMRIYGVIWLIGRTKIGKKWIGKKYQAIKDKKDQCE